MQDQATLKQGCKAESTLEKELIKGSMMAHYGLEQFWHFISLLMEFQEARAACRDLWTKVLRHAESEAVGLSCEELGDWRQTIADVI